MQQKAAERIEQDYRSDFRGAGNHGDFERYSAPARRFAKREPDQRGACQVSGFEPVYWDDSSRVAGRVKLSLATRAIGATMLPLAHQGSWLARR